MEGLGHAIYTAIPTFDDNEIFIILGDTVFDVDLKGVISDSDVTIESGAVIGEGVVIGKGTTIKKNANIGRNARIGMNCIITGTVVPDETVTE